MSQREEAAVLLERIAIWAKQLEGDAEHLRMLVADSQNGPSDGGADGTINRRRWEILRTLSGCATSFVNGSELQEMCFQKGVNWNNLPTAQRRGRCVTRVVVRDAIGEVVRSGWGTDHEVPIFTQERAYVERYLAVEAEE